MVKKNSLYKSVTVFYYERVFGILFMPNWCVCLLANSDIEIVML